MQQYKITEVTKIYDLDKDFIHICITNQWILPLDSKEGILDEEDLGRLFLIKDLQTTMGVNDEAIPVIMHLLDQIYWLKKKINTSPE